MLETSGTTITDIKGGVVWDVGISGTTGVGTTGGAYGGHSLVFNPGERSIMTTLTNVAGVGSNPIPLSAGAFSTFDHTKIQVALAVGYPDPTYTTHPRNALGDTNGLIYAGVQQGIGMAGNYFHTSWFGQSGGDGIHAANFGQIHMRMPLVNHPVDLNNGDVITPIYFETGLHSGVPCVQYSVASQNDSTQRYEARNANTWNLLVDSFGSEVHSNYSNATEPLQEFPGYVWVGGLTPAPCMRLSGMRLVGYALFEFDVLPADIDSALQWTAQQWLIGKRVIHTSLL